jgi:hypothetical protein
MADDSQPLPLAEVEFEHHLQALLEEGQRHIDSRIRGKREDAWARFYGKVDAKPVNGGSDIVVRSIQDSVGSIVPDLMEIYCSADAVVEFLPSAEGEFEGQLCKAANLAVISRFWDCGGWLATYDAVNEAVISGYGFYKVFMSEKYTKSYHEEALDEDDYMAKSEATTVLPAWDENDPNSVNTPEFGKFRWIETTKIEDIVIEAVPSSNMIWTYSPVFAESWLIGQITEVRIGTLVEMGFTPEELKNVTNKDRAVSKVRQEENARENDISSNATKNTFAQTTGSWAATKVAYYELYVKCDRDGDGTAEAYKVWMAGDSKTLIRFQPIDWREMPFILVPAYRIPHSTYSESASERLTEFQEAETRLLRSEVDLAEMIAGPMILNALGGGVDANKLANWKAHKVIDCRSPDAIKFFQVPDVGGSLLQFAQELKMRREDRSGVSRIGSSLRPEDMADVQATVAKEARASSEKKIQQLARLQAELAIKPLMAKVLDLLIQMEQVTVLYQGQPVTISTKDFNPQWKMRVKVGLGTGTRLERSATMMNLWQALTQVSMQLGPDNPLTDLSKLNNLIYDYGSMQPGMNVSRYIKSFEETQAKLAEMKEQPPPPDPKLEKIKADAQANQMKLEQNAQFKQQEMQQKIIENRAKLTFEQQAQMQKLMMESQNDQKELMMKYDLKMKELAGEFMLEEQRVEDDREIALIEARNNVEVRKKEARKLQ